MDTFNSSEGHVEKGNSIELLPFSLFMETSKSSAYIQVALRE
jgi:hypothetical protein